MSGKLDRTFTATDELIFRVRPTVFVWPFFHSFNMHHFVVAVCFIVFTRINKYFQDAKKEEAVRKAYKHLAALHEVGHLPLFLFDHHECVWELNRLCIYLFVTEL